MSEFSESLHFRLPIAMDGTALRAALEASSLSGAQQVGARRTPVLLVGSDQIERFEAELARFT